MALTVSQVNYKDSSSWTSLIDMIYPKGSIFLGYNLMSKNDATSANHPGKLFGGSWLPIENKMLRSGWGKAIGGNDAHTHVFGIEYVNFYGNLSFPDMNVDSTILSSTFPEKDTALGAKPFGGWAQHQLLVKGSSKYGSPWTNKGTYNEGAVYYHNEGKLTTSYGLTSKNIPYGRFTSADRQLFAKNPDSEEGISLFGLKGSRATQIPAYQTVNTWYRTS